MKLNKTSIPHAENVPFDNSTNGFTSDTVQDAIEEIGASASPGFTWGRSGASGSGTWLQNDSVPSNLAGRTLVLGDGKVVKIFSATEDANTYELTLYYHDGNSINLTTVTTLTVTASRTGDSGTINFSIPAGKQLAIRITSGSAKNIVAGVVLQGDT